VPEFRTGLARSRVSKAVSLRVIRQPGAEPGDARRVREALPELRRTLPEGMALTSFYDTGSLVEHALAASASLMIGALFVVLVLVALLGSVRAPRS